MDIRYNARFIDPLSDFGFKRIFGSEPNKDLLLDFLNAIFNGRKRIVDLVYNKSEHPGMVKDNRTVVYDLLCTGDNGAQFIIEVQKVRQQYFRDRCIFYTSSLICQQAAKGGPGWDYQLKEVYLIGLMDFCFDDTLPDQYIHDVQLVDVTAGRPFYKKLGYIFIEIPKFNKQEAALETVMDCWLFVLKHMYHLEKIPVFLKKSVFTKLFKISAMSALSKEDFMSYIRSQMRQWDHINTLRAMQQEGLEEGRKKGLAEGRRKGLEEGLEAGREEGRKDGLTEGQEEERIRIARNAKAKGLPAATIAELTGLSPDEVEQL